VSERALLRVAIAGLVLVLAACSGSGSPDRASPSPSSPAAGLRLTRDCPSRAPSDDITVDKLNHLVDSLDLDYWQAGDIGASGQLSDGRLVWAFGDTVRRTGVSPPVVANSLLVSTGPCVAQLIGADHGPVIPDVDATTVRWPMSVAVARTGEHDTVMVMCSRIRRGSQGSFDFTFLGTSVAVFTVEPGGVPQLDKVIDLTPDSTNPQQVNWGAASDVYDGWLYVYGTRLTGRPLDYGRELYVARAPVANPRDRSRWQFWGGDWQPDRGKAVAVLPSQGGVSQVLSVDSVGDTFVAVSKRDGDVNDYVYRWTAPHAWGPWTPSKEIRAPGGFDTGQLQYAPVAHPEVPLASGHLLISISRNTTDFQRLLKDPEIGRPFFAELTD
jgi:hypothetical protein